MALEQAFIDAFTSEISVETYTGEDAHGNNIYSTVVDTFCRIDSYGVSRGSLDQAEQLRGASVVSVSLIMADDILMNPRDRITLPNSKIVYATDVELQYDENGIHHQTVQAIEREIS